MHIFEENIKKLDLKIPDMPTPLANYVPFKVADNTVYVSGQGPVIDGKILYSGKVGVDISEEDGIKAAETCCINIIAALKTSIDGDWDRLDSFLKLGGFVNCNDNFTDQPKIINGAIPLNKSPTSTITAYFFPSARKTFEDPGFPLPIS